MQFGCWTRGGVEVGRREGETEELRGREEVVGCYLWGDAGDGEGEDEE